MDGAKGIIKKAGRVWAAQSQESNFMTQTAQDGVFAAVPKSKIQNPKSRIYRRIGSVALVLLLGLLLFLAYIGVFGGNVHVVQSGRIIRTAQLTDVGIQPETARLAGHGLADTLEKYHARTVINLRGKSDDADWYFAENRYLPQPSCRAP